MLNVPLWFSTKRIYVHTNTPDSPGLASSGSFVPFSSNNSPSSSCSTYFSFSSTSSSSSSSSSSSYFSFSSSSGFSFSFSSSCSCSLPTLLEKTGSQQGAVQPSVCSVPHKAHFAQGTQMCMLLIRNGLCLFLNICVCMWVIRPHATGSH